MSTLNSAATPPKVVLRVPRFWIYSTAMNRLVKINHASITAPREMLLRQLSEYRNAFPEEAETIERFAAFLHDREDAFLRSCGQGHVTGSAFIIDPSRSASLLVHHRKLDKWLQPGGHCDPGETAFQAALREAFEETGVTGTPFSPGRLFDIDIHSIPARPDAPGHLHYDARYLLVAEPGATILSHESHAVEWIELDEASRRNPEQSIARMIDKVKKISVQ